MLLLQMYETWIKNRKLKWLEDVVKQGERTRFSESEPETTAI